jgi:hypothetical protein
MSFTKYLNLLILHTLNEPRRLGDLKIFRVKMAS